MAVMTPFAGGLWYILERHAMSQEIPVPRRRSRSHPAQAEAPPPRKGGPKTATLFERVSIGSLTLHNKGEGIY